MTAIQFYHLTATTLERALPKLLEKAHGAGFRALVVAATEHRMDQMNQLLWTYDPDSFLPHGSITDGHSEDQPILLSTRMEPINGARLLLVTNGESAAQPDRFERIIDLFDGKDEQAVAQARSRWQTYKEAAHAMAYLRQNDMGGWEQKAVA